MVKRRRLEDIADKQSAREAQGDASQRTSAAPDHIPAETWRLIQETGHAAVERLHELLHSARFHRLKSSDQARLIALAQDRAFGRPDPGTKRTVKTVHHITDATAQHLTSAAARTALPEYRRSAPNAAQQTAISPVAATTGSKSGQTH